MQESNPDGKKMMDKLELTGSTIALRTHCLDDANSVYQAVRESISELIPWMPWCHTEYSLDETRIWIASRNEALAKGTEYDFLIVDRLDGSPLGGCGLNHINNNDCFANLGYWVRTSRAGQGVATAAVHLLAGFGFRELKLNRIEIVVARDNTASQRVAQKVGAKREGVLRRRLVVRGRVYDAIMFSLIPEGIAADFKDTGGKQ